MKTIFVTTEGEYDDYKITGVFSSREKAENWLRVCCDAEEPNIEEWKLDHYTKIKSEKIENMKVYIVGIKDGKITRNEDTERSFFWTSRAHDKEVKSVEGLDFQTYVFASSEKQSAKNAKKIFKENH
jgi:hypothetical protein